MGLQRPDEFLSSMALHYHRWHTIANPSSQNRKRECNNQPSTEEKIKHCRTPTATVQLRLQTNSFSGVLAGIVFVQLQSQLKQNNLQKVLKQNKFSAFADVNGS